MPVVGITGGNWRAIRLGTDLGQYRQNDRHDNAMYTACIMVRGGVLRLVSFMFDTEFYNCLLHMIICLKLFFKIIHGNLFQNLTYCAASVRTSVATNLVHVFHIEILFPL
jgi:hypothetical protein